VLRAVVLTQYRCVTNRQTDRRTDRDGIAVASKVLAMRALWHAAKKTKVKNECVVTLDFYAS